MVSESLLSNFSCRSRIDCKDHILSVLSRRIAIRGHNFVVGTGRNEMQTELSACKAPTVIAQEQVLLRVTAA